jgi:hypothetical protein
VPSENSLKQGFHTPGRSTVGARPLPVGWCPKGWCLGRGNLATAGDPHADIAHTPAFCGSNVCKSQQNIHCCMIQHCSIPQWYCIYIYTCIYVYIHVYMYICIYVYIYNVYIYTYI